MARPGAARAGYFIKRSNGHVWLRVFALADDVGAPFTVAALDGRVAARGTVARQGGRHVARITEGALRNWRLEVDGRTSADVAEGAELAWTS